MMSSVSACRVADLERMSTSWDAGTERATASRDANLPPSSSYVQYRRQQLSIYSMFQRDIAPDRSSLHGLDVCDHGCKYAQKTLSPHPSAQHLVLSRREVRMLLLHQLEERRRELISNGHNLGRCHRVHIEPSIQLRQLFERHSE